VSVIGWEGVGAGEGNAGDGSVALACDADGLFAREGVPLAASCTAAAVEGLARSAAGEIAGAACAVGTAGALPTSS